MKKILLTMLFGVAVASVAHSEVMYWMVGDDYGAAAATSPDMSATLYAVSGNTKNALGTQGATAIANAYDSYGNFEAQLGSSMGSGWSYFVEVVNAGNTYTTDSLSYADAVAAGYIYSNMALPVSASSIPNGGFGGGGTSYNVPEPTSGLLFLVGGMLLGLKRRRQQV